MSIVTVKDFGIALNISGGTIRSRISRGKLRCNKKGLIDTENPTNYIYLLEINGGDQSIFEQYHQGVNSKPKLVKTTTIPKEKAENVDFVHKEEVLSEKEEKEEKQNPSKIRSSVKVAPTVETNIDKAQYKLDLKEKRENEKENRSYKNLDLRKREAETALVERNAELRQWELEKKAGNTLPLDITTKVITILAQTVLSKFLLEAENMVRLCVEEFGGSRADTVRLTNKLRTSFTKTVEIAKDESTKKIETAVSEYSEVRSRGERK
jgi:hypothetical protein